MDTPGKSKQLMLPWVKLLRKSPDVDFVLTSNGFLE